MASGDDQQWFGCPYCSEVFATMHELEVHQKMTHPGQPFKYVMVPMPDRERRMLDKAPTSAISKNMPMSEVSRHCVPEDCWVAIKDKIYDLTEFMDRHPGGPTTILNWAGKDATKMFFDIHKGVKIEQYLRPEAFVGDLGVDEQLMSDDFWHTLRKARIVEVQTELDQLLGDGVEKASAGFPRKASGLLDVLQHKGLNPELKSKLQALETQKRVALDAEDYEKAQEITSKVDLLLAQARVDVPRMKREEGSGGIPLSEIKRHNKPHDCWIAIQGTVYDLTDFLIQHPEQRNAVLAWAGRDASPMWNKIPGRFPSSTWMDFYMRPEAKLGELGSEPPVDPKLKMIKQLKMELRRLEGPSEDDIQAHKAAGAAKAGAAAAASKESEESRFPKLKGIASGKELPFFSRAEVASHKGPADPYMIIHNKVYNLSPLLGNHPGGDEMLLTRAGTDATKEFELFEHSEKARVRRDQDMLVGEVVPAEHVDWAAEAKAEGGVEGGEVKAQSELVRYLRYKVGDAAVALLGIYVYKTLQHRKPLSSLTYSRGLRHLHLIMAVGIFGAVGSAQAAARTEGLAKKRWLQLHKQSGVAMLLALLVRIVLRLRSGIPPRFPGHPVVKAIETSSLRAFYLLALVLPVSGIANEYYLKWAQGDDAENGRKAQQAITLHTRVGRFFEYAWLPFHLGYTTAFHYSRGRGVVRKVSPFI